MMPRCFVTSVTASVLRQRLSAIMSEPGVFVLLSSSLSPTAFPANPLIPLIPYPWSRTHAPTHHGSSSLASARCVSSFFRSIFSNSSQNLFTRAGSVRANANPGSCTYIQTVAVLKSTALNMLSFSDKRSRSYTRSCTAIIPPVNLSVSEKTAMFLRPVNPLNQGSAGITPRRRLLKTWSERLRVVIALFWIGINCLAKAENAL